MTRNKLGQFAEKPLAQRRKRIDLRLLPSLLECIDAYAQAQGITRTKAVEYLLERGLYHIQETQEGFRGK